MKIINAKKTSIAVILSNGDTLSIDPGTISNPLVADPNMIRALVVSNKPEEIGIVLGSSYELEIANKLSGSMPFLYHDEDAAKAKLLEGKDFTPKLDNPGAIDTLRLELAKANEELEKFKSQPDGTKVLLTRIDGLVEDLRLASEDLTAKNQTIEDLTAKVTELSSEDQSAKIAELNGTIEKLNQDLNNLRTEGTKLFESYTKLNSTLDTITAQYHLELNPSTGTYEQIQKLPAEPAE